MRSHMRVERRLRASHHMYAKMEYAEVVRKTPSCLIERTSPSGRQTMHTPVIT